MRKKFHIILKLLLVLVIFLGLQGKVIARYIEICHQNHNSYVTCHAKAKVKARIIHCKLQCYTRHFKTLDIPLIPVLLALIATPQITELFDISFREKSPAVYPIQLIPLRAPPVA